MRAVWTGTLDKMRVAAAEDPADPVSYWLHDGAYEGRNSAPDHFLNDYLGQAVELRFSGRINCLACGRETRKSFSQGYCFPCSRSRPEADICIIKPELCHYHHADQPCRDEVFAQGHCFRPHYLYCALTSGVKIGITRAHNIPARWIDQGAVAAIPVALLPSRGEVGLVEKRLSDAGFADKTHWTRMLKGNPPEDFDLVGITQRVVSRLRAWSVEGILPPEERVQHTFVYPVRTWPRKVQSFNLDKEPVVAGVLEGIKGQYLIFDSGVINLRKYSGYRVDFAV